MVTMSEVLTQLPPANSGEALPAGAAPSVSASPADNVTLNNQTPAASSEKPATGTGWGVDLDKVNDTESLAAAIEAMNLPPLPDESAPPEAQAPAPAPAATAPAAEALTRPGEMPRNIKMPVRDELDWRVASAIKDARLNGRELSFAEAEAQARTALGMVPAASPALSATAPEATSVPASPPEQSTDLNAAYEQYQRARESFDAEAEATALQEINRLNRLETMREFTAMQQQNATAVQQQEQFNQRWEQTLATAATAYTDAANPDSALSQRAAEIQQSYAASQDPAQQAIYNSPTSALLYYQLAAADLQVAPQATPAAPAPPVHKSTPQPVLGRQPPMAALLAGGQSGNPAPAAPSFDPGRIQTSHELDTLVEFMEGRWAA